MSSRRKRRATYVPQKRWQRIEHHIVCANGSHHVYSGYALFWPWRPDRPRYVLCENHANAIGFVRVETRMPPRDGKVEALGNDQ